MKIVVKTNLIILFVFLGLRDCHQLLQDETNSVELRIALYLDHFVDLAAVSRPARIKWFASVLIPVQNMAKIARVMRMRSLPSPYSDAVAEFAVLLQ